MPSSLFLPINTALQLYRYIFPSRTFTFAVEQLRVVFVDHVAFWNTIGSVPHVNLHAPNQVACVTAGMPEPGWCQYGKACFNIKGCHNRHPVEEICLLVDTCNDYHCNKRHSKSRPRPCNFGLKCKKHGRQFLHPTGHCAGSSSGNNNGLLATVKSTPTPVKPTTKMLKFTGFGHQIDDFTVAGQKLQDALRSLGDQEVYVNIPQAGISQSGVVGFAHFSSTGFAEAAAQHFKSVPATLELGDLRAELYFGEKMQQGNASASTPPVAQANLANAHARPAGVCAQPASRPSLVQGSSNAQVQAAILLHADSVQMTKTMP